MEKKNVIVLLADTVRASDVYGNPQMHFMGYLSRTATSYLNTVAPGSWTAPTHASLFTNRRVSSISRVSQDFLDNGTHKIDPWMVKTKFLENNDETIARKMTESGYQSVLFSNNPFLTSFTNLATGFERVQDVWLDSNVKYDRGTVKKFTGILNGGAKARSAIIDIGYIATRLLPKGVMDSVYLSLRRKMFRKASEIDGTYRIDRGASDTNSLLEDHFQRSYNYKPQFIFINYMEAHEAYPARREVPQDKWFYLAGIDEMSDYNMKTLHRAYLRRLRYLDKSMMKTVGILRSKGILDNATLIITSDHGQAFGEHGQLYHSLPPYEQISKVPLIAANYENGKLVKMRDRVETTVSLRSVHDAILNLSSGRFGHLDGNLRKDRYVMSEHMGISEGWDEKLLKLLAPRAKTAASVLAMKRKFNIHATAIYRENMKLMHFFGKRKDELYDVSKDPAEQNNIIGSNRALALSMAAAA